MAESHKFSTLAKALEVFPELTWAQDADGNTYVDNSKTGERVTVSKGQYIVHVADRYEVHDDEPSNAKTAEKPKADENPAGNKSNPQVAPESLGAAPDSEAAAPTSTSGGEVSGTPAGE